jgi:hypothetical protein
MTKGPAKISVKINGEDSQAVADEAWKLYCDLVYRADILDARS